MIESAYERVLPHDPAAERAVLGAILIDGSAAGEAAAILRGVERPFFFERHGELFAVLCEMVDRGQEMDGVIIAAELKNRGRLESLGGYEFLLGLAHATPSALRVQHYAELVRDCALRRNLIGAAHSIMEEAFEVRVSHKLSETRDATRALLDNAERRIFALTQQNARSESSTPANLMGEVLATLAEQTDGPAGLRTGFLMLDGMIDGLKPGNLIVIGGRPSMGKTALGLNIAANLAAFYSEPSLFISLEMSRAEVATRLLFSESKVNWRAYRGGNLRQEGLDLLERAAEKVRRWPITVDDESGLTVMQVRGKVRAHVRRNRTSAVFVDFLTLMRGMGLGSKYEEVTEMAVGLKDLAKEVRLPVVVMAQLNRKTEDRADHRPGLGDLRDSGAIEQAADVVLLIHRKGYYAQRHGDTTVPDNDADIIVAKNRNGPTGDVRLNWTGSYARFDDSASAEAYAVQPAAQRDLGYAGPF